MPTTPPYSLEFRREAVRLLRSSGRSIPQLASAGNITFGVDDGDRRTCTAYPNGIVVQNSYNKDGSLTATRAAKGSCGSNGTPTGTQISSFVYGLRAPVDNPETPYDDTLTDGPIRWSVTDLAGNVTRYNYDKLDRLTDAQTKNSVGSVTDTRHYALDNVGNVTARIVNGTTTNLAYDAANRISSSGYSYDADGNLTVSPNLSYTYNQREQATSVTPVGGSAQALNYLGPGQATLTAANSSTYTNSILGISSQSTGCILLVCSSVNYYVRDNRGQLLAQRQSQNSNACYYYIEDGLGSVIALTDSGGNVANTYRYDPYGQTVSETGSVDNPFTFAGGLTTAGASLKFGERYYDPSSGRWSQPDPVDQTGDPLNGDTYGYAASDPVNNVDPNGTCVVNIFCKQQKKVAITLAGVAAAAGVGGTVSAIPGVGPEVAAGAGGCAGNAVRSALNRKGSVTQLFVACIEGGALGAGGARLTAKIKEVAEPILKKYSS